MFWLFEFIVDLSSKYNVYSKFKWKNQNIQNFTWLKKSFPMQMESQKIAQSECIKKWILDSKKKICYVSTHNIACIWRADGLILYKLVSDPIVCYWTIKHV